ncbi:MAG: mandelate racemase/muconate lactonizing enzyme family protein [Caldilineaceae bacterium]
MENSAQLRITDIKLHRLRTIQEVGSIEPAWSPGSQMAFALGGGSVVEIFTDQGISGIGPGCHPEVLAAAQAHLIGQDPFATEQHVRTLRYYAAGLPYRGAAGIDIALWDIIGKACGQPLYKLWGGNKSKVPAYASMVRLSTPEERADLAVQLADEGWQAIKLRIHHPTLQEDIRTVATVRDAVGDRMTIMVDANQAQSSGNWQPGILWDFRRALETAKALDQLNVYWLEEPLPRFSFKELAKINAEVAMPLAGGENNRAFHEFVQMVQEDVYDVLQPESMVCEGITTLRKIGVLAEAFGKQVVPHHGGRNLGTIAHLHLVASWPHSPYLEVLHDPPIGEYQNGFSILATPPVIDSEGFIAVPQGPGLGVEIRRDLILP